MQANNNNIIITINLMLMRKCTIYLALLLMFLPMGVLAQEPEAMNVHNGSGLVQSTLLVNIQHITFSNDMLILTTSEGEFRLPLSDVSYIVFGDKQDTPTGIENVNANNVHISLIGTALTVSCEYAIHSLFLVDITGKMITSQKLNAVKEANVTLPNVGVYVLFLQTSEGYIARKIINN